MDVFGSIAQSVERRPVKATVVGSSPTIPATGESRKLRRFNTSYLNFKTTPPKRVYESIRDSVLPKRVFRVS